MGRKHAIKKKELLNAIQGSYGIISTIASRLHVEWHTARDAIDKWEEAQRALIDEEESKLDYVEGKAIKAIENNDGAMIRFYLATKGKKRGFTYESEKAIETEKTDTEIKINLTDTDGAENGN